MADRVEGRRWNRGQPEGSETIIVARIDVTAAADNSLQDLRPADQSDRFRDPLGFIYTEHYRNRIICNTLDSATPARQQTLSIQELDAIVDFYSIDRPLHIADEEELLFPLLRKRCEPSDNLPEILALLEAEHRSDQPLIDSVIEGLASLIKRGAVPDFDLFTAKCRAMCDFQRRHLAWENSVVMPLAKRRLTAPDLVDLGRAMAERRGMTLDDDS